MIWATVEDVRAELGDTAGDQDEIAREIRRAVRTLDAIAVRYPVLDDAGRVLDPDRRADVVAAVAELIRYRRDRTKAKAATPGLEIVERGGRIKSATLEVAGGTRSSGGGSVVDRDTLVPLPVIEAMQSAGMIGGSVASW